jgi:hypothetical protein
MIRHAVPAIALAAALALPAAAQQPSEPYPEKPVEKEQKPERVPTPEERAEKAQRRVCKVQICSIFASGEREGADVDCPIVKTWREDDIEEILGRTFTWPWGKARCATQLKLKRSMLAAAAGEGTNAKLDTHTIACSLDLKSDGATYDVKVDIAPQVTFKGGRATKAKVNWAKVEAPMLAYSVIWPGTALDNSANVLQGQLVKMINEFMGRKCAAVTDQTPVRASVSPAN